jgi:hypothetical protein
MHSVSWERSCYGLKYVPNTDSSLAVGLKTGVYFLPEIGGTLLSKHVGGTPLAFI